MEENEAVVTEGIEAAVDVPEETVESEPAEDDSPSSENEPTSTESDGSEEPASSDEPEDLTEEEKSSLSDKTNKRIRYLAEKVKRYEEAQGVGLSGAAQTSQPESALPWMQKPEVSREVTQEEYERELTEKANTVVKAQMAEYERRQRIRDDVRLVEQTYEELNPESDNYDEKLSDMLGKQFSKIAKADPSASLADYVEEVMSLRESGKNAGKSEVSAKVVQQAANQALSPKGESEPTEGSSEDELIKLRKEGKISFDEFERRIEELGK